MTPLPNQAEPPRRGAVAHPSGGEKLGVSRTVLLAVLGLGPRLPAGRVAEAISAGLTEKGLPEPEVAMLDAPDPVSGEAATAAQNGATAAAGVAAASPAAIDFEERMRAARAVVILAPSLDEDMLLGSIPFEIATRCRQAGVPCYAITRRNDLDLFDARILDLQVVIEARSARALRRAGASLAEIL